MRLFLVPIVEMLHPCEAFWFVGFALLGTVLGTAQAKTRIDALDLHRQALVFDAHSDTMLRVVEDRYELGERHTERHIDLPRLRQGGVDVEGFALWVDPRKYAEHPSARAFALLEALEDQLRKNCDQMVLVRSATQARQVAAKGKVGVLLGIEGGHAIENRLDLLEAFYNRGARYMTLTWMKTNDLADSSDDKPRWAGLSEQGVAVVREMNRLGMMIDLSHGSDETVRDVLEVSQDPVILTHSCARALCDIPRNVSDELLREVARRGGVVGVNFYLGYLVQALAEARKARHEHYHSKDQQLREAYGAESDRYKEEIERLRKKREEEEKHLPGAKSDYRIIVDHIDHMVQVAGIDHVGIGSDFDGVNLLPVGIKDVSDLPKLTKELVARGYSVEDIRKILGENFMRVFAQVCDH